MIISEKILGSQISVVIESSNLKEATYDTTNKTLLMTFKNNRKYQYNDVAWEIFTKFRMAESQGKFFNGEIAKKYTYKELKEDDTAGTNQ
jgi:hypothetical protein